MTTSLHVVPACAWCGHPFEPNTFGRPRVYCSIGCRQDAGHYREDLPRWQADLAQLEASARGYRGTVPPFLRNEIADLRRLIDGRPTW